MKGEKVDDRGREMAWFEVLIRKADRRMQASLAVPLLAQGSLGLATGAERLLAPSHERPGE